MVGCFLKLSHRSISHSLAINSTQEVDLRWRSNSQHHKPGKIYMPIAEGLGREQGLHAKTAYVINYSLEHSPTWETSALVGMVTGLSTGAAIETLRWSTREGGHLTCATAVTRLALAAERPMGIHTEATIETHARLAALINVITTVLSLESRWTGTVVIVIPIGTTGAVGTGTGGTGINEGAVLA